jgi:hypothetical protein
MNEFERFIWCLERDFPHEIIVTLLDPNNTVNEAWQVWLDSDHWYLYESIYVRREAFQQAIQVLCDFEPVICEDCNLWSECEDEAVTVAGGHTVCQACADDRYTSCDRCGEYNDRDYICFITDIEEYYCDSCRDYWCSWCEYCEEYYRNEHDDHEDACDCEPVNRKFRFHANGKGTVKQDKRLTVTLPAGTIDDEGLRLIRYLLRENIQDGMDANGYTRYASGVIHEVMEAIGDTWHGKKGNYTRRLSREFYSNHKIKVPEGVLTEVGNLARQHSSDTSEWAVEFTRNLNLSAEDFYHDDSCWWQSYYESRCALKSWGGLAIRSFDEHDNVSGRAFIQPLNDEFAPTHATINAHAFLVYNCYGDLDQAKAARIVSHLTSRTYRKIMVNSDPQYINGDMGWLVADEQTCVSAGEALGFGWGSHDLLDANRHADLEVATS